MEAVAPNALGAPAANAAKPPDAGADAGGTAVVPKLGFPKANAPKLGCVKPDCPNPLFPSSELGAAVELNAEVLVGAALLNAEPLAGTLLNADALDPPPNALNGLFLGSTPAKAPKPVPGLINAAPDEAFGCPNDDWPNDD